MISIFVLWSILKNIFFPILYYSFSLSDRCYGQDMFIENSEEFIEKLQGIIGKLCKIARYKIDKKKLLHFYIIVTKN